MKLRILTICTLVLGGTSSIVRAEVPSHPALGIEEPPKIDGVLDEAVWKQAAAAHDLIQVEPRPGKPMTEDTEVRILHDQRALYIGVRCYDSDPAGIRACGRERDGSVLIGDNVVFFFDTFHDSRNGYAFAVSPDEGLWDATVSNIFTADTNWDGMWQVRCRIDDRGWTAEIEIPLTTLTYDPDDSTWGFNFSRNIARKGERGSWASARPEVQVYYAANAGELTGMNGLPKRLGLEFSPYVLARTREQRGRDNTATGDVGFDLRCRLTPGVTATLSVNTDFAETEVDQRQINFSRFPLFFPEKRDFFLEDSRVYRFSDLNEGLMIPYFTRRVGLSTTGQSVPILAAAKVSGHFDDSEIGVTTAHLDSAYGVEEKTVFAGRITHQLNDESSVGFIATAGDPRSNGDNAVAGFDYRYQTSQWMNDETLVANLFCLASQTDPVAAEDFSGHAYGFGLTWPGDRINIQLQAAEISGGYDPALGFIRRNDVRYYSGSWRYLVRPDDPAWYQSLSFVCASQLYTDLDNNLKTMGSSIYPLLVRFPSNDELSFGITNATDRPDYSFTLPGNVTVPEGSYDNMLTYDLKWTFSEVRPISGDAGVQWGDYYGGDWRSAYSNLWWIPGSLTALGLSYEYNYFDLPGGKIDSNLLSLWLVLRFTPHMRWSNLVQYDTISQTIGYNSRFSWEYQPGKTFNAVLSQLYWDDTTGFQRLDTEFIAKLSMQLRF